MTVKELTDSVRMSLWSLFLVAQLVSSVAAAAPPEDPSSMAKPTVPSHNSPEITITSRPIKWSFQQISDFREGQRSFPILVWLILIIMLVAACAAIAYWVMGFIREYQGVSAADSIKAINTRLDSYVRSDRVRRVISPQSAAEARKRFADIPRQKVSVFVGNGEDSLSLARQITRLFEEIGWPVSPPTGIVGFEGEGIVVTGFDRLDPKLQSALDAFVLPFGHHPDNLENLGRNVEPPPGCLQILVGRQFIDDTPLTSVAGK